jgi:hypothetical protein
LGVEEDGELNPKSEDEKLSASGDFEAAEGISRPLAWIAGHVKRVDITKHWIYSSEPGLASEEDFWCSCCPLEVKVRYCISHGLLICPRETLMFPVQRESHTNLILTFFEYAKIDHLTYSSQERFMFKLRFKLRRNLISKHGSQMGR